MKITPYRSQAQVSGESGSIFNPGVRIPQNLANFQAEAASGASKFLDTVSEWAVKKQELQDQSEIRKATVAFEEELRLEERRLLYPDKDDIASYRLTTKLREGRFNRFVENLEKKYIDKYTPLLGTKTSKGFLANELKKSLAVTRKSFESEINKRTKNEYVAAQIDQENKRVADLSDRNIDSHYAKMVIEEQNQNWGEQVNIGSITGKDLAKRKKEFYKQILTNRMIVLASEHLNGEGVIKADWIDTLTSNSENAFTNDAVTHEFWKMADAEQRQDIINEIYKQRKDLAKVAEENREQQDNDNRAIFTDIYLEMSALSNLPPTPENLQDRNQVLIEAKAFIEANPDLKNGLSIFNKMQNLARAKPADEFQNPQEYQAILLQQLDPNHVDYGLTDNEIFDKYADILPFTGTYGLGKLLEQRKSLRQERNRSIIKILQGGNETLEQVRDFLGDDDEAYRQIVDNVNAWNEWDLQNPNASFEARQDKVRELKANIKISVTETFNDAFTNAYDTDFVLQKLEQAVDSQGIPVIESWLTLFKNGQVNTELLNELINNVNKAADKADTLPNDTKVKEAINLTRTAIIKRNLEELYKIYKAAQESAADE